MVILTLDGDPDIDKIIYIRWHSEVMSRLCVTISESAAPAKRLLNDITNAKDEVAATKSSEGKIHYKQRFLKGSRETGDFAGYFLQRSKSRSSLYSIITSTVSGIGFSLIFLFGLLVPLHLG